VMSWVSRGGSAWFGFERGGGGTQKFAGRDFVGDKRF